MIVGCLLIASPGFAQAPAFDVASIRPAAPAGPNENTIGLPLGGPGTSDPETFRIRSAALRDLLTRAYQVRYIQFEGPSWLTSAQFDITAKVPPGATKEQFNLMLQDFLMQRFHVTLHHETKSFSAYNLVVEKRGVKLKQSDPEVSRYAKLASQNPLAGLLGMKNYGGIIPRPGGFLINGGGLPIGNLASIVESVINVPVLDKTGLTGFYDFEIEFAADDAAGSSALPSIFTALENEAGLKLEAVKAPFDVIVIDHIDMTPDEN